MSNIEVRCSLAHHCAFERETLAGILDVRFTDLHLRSSCISFILRIKKWYLFTLSLYVGFIELLEFFSLLDLILKGIYFLIYSTKELMFLGIANYK